MNRGSTDSGTTAGLSSQPASQPASGSSSALTEPADPGQGSWTDVAARGRAPLWAPVKSDGLNCRLICLLVTVFVEANLLVPYTGGSSPMQVSDLGH